MAQNKNVLEYSKLKQSARQKRVNRIIWIDSKIIAYQEEKVKLQKEVDRDTAAKERLEAMESSVEGLKTEIDDFAKQARELTGEPSTTAWAKMVEKQEELDALYERMRQEYYGK